MSAGEIIIILFVYLLFFGAKGLPSLAQTLGKAVYQFRNATQDIQREIMDGANEIKKQAQANVKLDQMDIDLDEPKTNSVPQTPAAPPTPPPPPPPAQELIDK
ncbi:MAG: Sec-independent protein translocase subunit TatA/TatB [Flavobacteriales bacterium]|jgi:sec-independent protein translocase protein TatA